MAAIRGSIIIVWVFAALSSTVQSQVSGECLKLFIYEYEMKLKK